MKKLIGRRDIEDALSRLDKLTREEFQAAIAQVLKVTHDVDEGVKNVGEKVDVVDAKLVGVGAKVDDVSAKMVGVDEKVVGMNAKVVGVDAKVVGVDAKVVDVDAKVDGVDSKVDSVDVKVMDIDDKVNVAVAGTLITFATRKRHSKPVRLDGKVVKLTTMETKTLVQEAANKMEEEKRSLYYSPPLLAVYAEMPLQVSRHGRTTEYGCLRRTHLLIKTLRPVFNMMGRPRGSSREVSLRGGSPSRPHPCYGSTGNVCHSVPLHSAILIASKLRSWFGKEYPLVRSYFLGSHSASLVAPKSTSEQRSNHSHFIRCPFTRKADRKKTSKTMSNLSSTETRIRR